MSCVPGSSRRPAKSARTRRPATSSTSALTGCETASARCAAVVIVHGGRDLLVAGGGAERDSVRRPLDRTGVEHALGVDVVVAGTPVLPRENCSAGSVDHHARGLLVSGESAERDSSGGPLH